MALGLAIGAGLAVASALRRKKSSGVDTGPLLRTIRSGAQNQKNIAAGLQTKLEARRSTFETGARESFGEFKTGALRQIDEGRTALSDLNQIQGTKLARTLQERSFRPVRGATEFVRQNLSTTKSGAANEALAAPAIQAQQQFGQALNDLTSQILQGEIDLANQANVQKLNLVEKEMGFEQGLLATIFKSGSDQDKALVKELLEIQNQQTANELQAIQFGISGNLAADAANSAASSERDAALFGVGGQLSQTLFSGTPAGPIQDIGGGRTTNKNIFSASQLPGG